MSIATLKRKSKTLYGSTHSGTNPNGFSINGGTRNIGYVGKDCIRSSTGTRMNGIHPYGYGGTLGQYSSNSIMYNVNNNVLATQSLYIKPSVVSTQGMLHSKYKCIYNGTYPNTIVKNVYTGNLTDNSSQGNYINKLQSSVVNTLDVNNTYKFVNICKNNDVKTQHKKIYPGMRIGNYMKPPKQALDASTYLLHITNTCVNIDTHLPKPNNGNCIGCRHSVVI